MFQDVYDGFTCTTLPNGLTVYVQERTVSWVYAGVVVHAGAKEDPPGRQGLAHLVEHLVSENVEGLPFLALKQRFHALGATAQFGMTSYLSTTFDFQMPAEEPAVQEALTLVGTMLLQGRLTRQIEEEKTVIQREYHIDYPHAFSRSWALEGRPWLFERHPRLGSFHSALGVLDEWMPCSQPEIQAFYDRHYTPANMSLVCLGALSAERLLSLLEQTPFVISKPGARTPLPTAYAPTPPSRQEQVIHLAQFSHLVPAQTTCTVEWVIPLHVRRYQVFLLADLLEDLLTEQWRDLRALTYDVSVGSEYYQDCRVLTLHSELPPDRVALAQGLLWRTLDAIVQTMPRFMQVKQKRIASLHRLDYSGRDVLQATLDDLAGYHRLIPFTEELHQLEQIQFADVVELAASLTPEQHFCFMTCP